MERIVLFDGVCNFCNGAVNFIIRHDRDKKFKFAALQSDVGIDLLAKFDVPSDVDSIVLLENHAPDIDSSAGVSVAVGSAFLHSTAALQIARALGGIFSLLFVFVIVPTPIRDWFYKLFAKYRYRLLGKRDVCMVPTADVRNRFVSEKPPEIAHVEWWLMWCDFPNLNWARLRIYSDNSADVFDMDGRLIRFATSEEARDELGQDEYSELSTLDLDDEAELGVPLNSLSPPKGNTEAELLKNMYIKVESE